MGGKTRGVTMNSLLRRNKNIIISFCALITTMLLTQSLIKGNEDPFSFGSLFGENFDFGEFVKELENELEQELRKEQQSPSPEPTWSPPNNEIPQTVLPQQTVKIQKNDLKSNFLDSLSNKETGSNSKQTLEEIPSLKKHAYHYHMGNLVEHLRTIESAIIGDVFSQSFKDRFEQSYKQHIDTFESEYELISSHNAYLTTFFSSDKERVSLRKDIYGLFESLSKVVQKIPSIKQQDIKDSYKQLKKIKVPLPKLDQMSTIERRTSIRQKKIDRSPRGY